MRKSKNGNQRWGEFKYFKVLAFKDFHKHQEFKRWLTEEMKGDYHISHYQSAMGYVHTIHIEVQRDSVLLKLTWNDYSL